VPANLQPGHQDTWVDYKSDTVTEIVEFEGPHFMVALDGWEEIADHALAWAVEHSTRREPAAS
jgi:hypothetical protein